MRRTELFCPATREAPGDGTATTRLLSRAGYVRDFGNGFWGLTPVGERVREKLVARIDAAFRAADGEAVRLPVTEWGCVAPFRAAVVPIGGGEAATVAAEIHDAVGDVLLYDGDRAVGERFAESELLGVPATVIVGDTYRATGRVEIERRDGATTRHEPDAVAAVLERFAAGP